MATLRQGELFQAVLDGLRHHTEAVLYVDGHHPYTISVDGHSITVFVANVTHAYRADPDEYRIQCPGTLPGDFATLKASEHTICVLGYHSELDAFSAWDPDRFVLRSQSAQRFSMYTRLSSLVDAKTNGWAVYRDSTGQNTLSFRSEFLGLYVTNTGPMHRARETALRNIVDAQEQAPTAVGSKRIVSVAKKRIDVTRRQYVRNPMCRRLVLDAYEHRCAMCGVQLELMEAAHVVPHSHPSGLDVVSNGIALCSLHHKALDTGLVYVEKDYSIQVNPVRRRYLVRTGRMDGFNRFRRQLKPVIAIPEDPADSLHGENIDLGNRLRGILVEEGCRSANGTSPQ